MSRIVEPIKEWTRNMKQIKWIGYSFGAWMVLKFLKYHPELLHKTQSVVMLAPVINCWLKKEPKQSMAQVKALFLYGSNDELVFGDTKRTCFLQMLINGTNRWGPLFQDSKCERLQQERLLNSLIGHPNLLQWVLSCKWKSLVRKKGKLQKVISLYSTKWSLHKLFFTLKTTIV